LRGTRVHNVWINAGGLRGRIVLTEARAVADEGGGPRMYQRGSCPSP